YGAQGYGLYWYCIEQICADLEPALTFELEHDSEILAHELRIDTLLVEEMMRYMVEIGLFEESQGVVTCLKLAAHLGDSLTRNVQLKAIIKQAKSKTVSDGIGLSHGEERRGEEKKEIKHNGQKSATSDRVPVREIVDLYHQTLPELPRIEKITAARRGHIQQRWREDLPSLDRWENFFTFVRRSDFLMGRAEPRPGSKPFRADLEWMTKAGNFAKIAEEKYHGQVREAV
ncbi:MAG: Lin1244/Lin1753 domain-containing protein, partial [Kangiellaceae bacterium]|nr:Lin1244/Lin1753 domain-containing protein [Kangiellaceae bacterium]